MRAKRESQEIARPKVIRFSNAIVLADAKRRLRSWTTTWKSPPVKRLQSPLAALRALTL